MSWSLVCAWNNSWQLHSFCLETNIKGSKSWKNGIIRVSAPLFCLCERNEHGVDVCLRAQAAVPFEQRRLQVPQSSSPRDTASTIQRLQPSNMHSTLTAVRTQAFFKQRACSGAHAFVSRNSQSRVRSLKKIRKSDRSQFIVRLKSLWCLDCKLVLELGNNSWQLHSFCLETDIKGLKSCKNGIIRVSASFLSVREKLAWCGYMFARTGRENIRRRDEADASYFIAPGYSVNEPAPPSVQHAFHVNNGACSGNFQTSGFFRCPCFCFTKVTKQGAHALKNQKVRQRSVTCISCSRCYLYYFLRRTCIAARTLCTWIVFAPCMHPLQHSSWSLEHELSTVEIFIGCHSLQGRRYKGVRKQQACPTN